MSPRELAGTIAAMRGRSMLVALTGLLLLACRRGPDATPAPRPPADDPADPPSPAPVPVDPPVVDTDGDGIPDEDDRCPTNPETFNAYEDLDGCPDEIPAQLSTARIPSLAFAANTAAITPDMRTKLDAAAVTLREYPYIRFELRGHTTADEPAALSLTRAEQARDYLLGKGIAAAQLTVSAAADDEPIDLSGTPAAHAKNRRVEFRALTE